MNAHADFRSLLELVSIDTLSNLLHDAREFMSESCGNGSAGERMRRTDRAAGEGSFIALVQVATGSQESAEFEGAYGEAGEDLRAADT